MTFLHRRWSRPRSRTHRTPVHRTRLSFSDDLSGPPTSRGKSRSRQLLRLSEVAPPGTRVRLSAMVGRFEAIMSFGRLWHDDADDLTMDIVPSSVYLPEQKPPRQKIIPVPSWHDDAYTLPGGSSRE